jgi:Mg-chelatase subunit ChlD
VTLLHPHWLFLAVPLGVVLWLFPPPSRLQRVLRCAGLVLLLLALAGFAVLLPSRVGTVIVIADRSASMPADAEVNQQAVVELLQSRMGSSDQLGVLSFGQKVMIDRAPQTGQFSGFQSEVGRDGSDLADAIEMALQLIPRDSPGRVLVLSDGRWTGSDPASKASSAAAREIALDYRCLERPRTNDLAIERVDAPSAVAPGESFLITAWVQCPREQEVDYQLRDRERRIAAGRQRLHTGLNRLTFRDRAAEGGNHAYTLSVQGARPEDDPVPGNNLARVLVGIQGPKPVLHVTRSPQSGLAKLLEKGGLKLDVAAPETCRWTLEDLSRYSAVVLENVPAELVGHNGMVTLSTWVREAGAGLLMTGGRESYGPGGYYKSALEPILPVSLELRNEHRELALAMVVTLDRSGSMAMPVGGGRAKMDLANLGTASVLDMLGPRDEFGCHAVDTVSHVVAPLAKVTGKKAIRDRIMGIQSMGGGIYVHVALEAAFREIGAATAGTRHIILFSDAQDSEEPGDYKTLLDKITKAGVTVSVIGLGKKTDVDGPLLEDIARLGKGRCFFTDKPEELPRLFAQDTFVVARNTFLDEKTGVKETAGLAILTGRALGLDTTVGGYNLCYMRGGANLASQTLDKYKAPLVASWQAGTGRVVCYTGEADGKYAGAIAGWERVGEFYTSLVRWAAGQTGPLPDNMMLTQEVRNGVQRVTLHLDPERKGESFTELPTAKILKAEPGQTPTEKSAVLRWTGADTLTLEVPLEGNETALTTVTVPGQNPITLPPVCLPYSPELRPQTGESGRAVLDRLARATGGKERDVELEKIWQDLPRKTRLIPMTPWLLLLAVLMILLEVLERRTWLLSSPRWLMRSTRAERTARHAAARPGPVQPALPVPEAAPPLTAAAQAPAAEETAGMVDAIRKARERSRNRME